MSAKKSTEIVRAPTVFHTGMFRPVQVVHQDNYSSYLRQVMMRGVPLVHTHARTLLSLSGAVQIHRKLQKLILLNASWQGLIICTEKVCTEIGAYRMYTLMYEHS